jgi:2',3'-cyclic-nucleotide 2'-phosphodiesterase
MNDLGQLCSPNTFKILMVGDVIGKPGRKVLKRCLSELREHIPLDFVTINGENLAGGFGITLKTYAEVLSLGVNAVTMGNHWHSKPDVHTIRRSEPSLVLPLNLQDVQGLDVFPRFEINDGKTEVVIVNLMGLFAMKDSYADPFKLLESKKSELVSLSKSGSCVILVDFHGEASSEKQATWHYLDGIATAMIGTHTHTPTSDERVSINGSAFLTDVGMTGPYDSVIGMHKQKALLRYFGEKKKGAHEVAEGNSWFSGFLVEVDKISLRATAAHRLQWREEEGEWRISTALPNCVV